jgi:hypothetical protein
MPVPSEANRQYWGGLANVGKGEGCIPEIKILLRSIKRAFSVFPES